MLTQEKKFFIKQSGYRSAEILSKKIEEVKPCNIIENILKDEILEISKEIKLSNYEELFLLTEHYFDS